MSARPSIGLLASGALLIAACAGPSGTPEVSTASRQPAAASEQPSAEPSPEACPYNDSPCLGPLDAGTYHTDPTEGFWFPLEYTVPEGWDNIEDYPNAFDLRYTEYATDGGWNAGGLTAGIAVFLDMGTAPADDPCHEVAPSRLQVEQWVELLTNDPDIVASAPQQLTVGGFEGVSFDVAISPEYTGTCFFGREMRTKGFLVQPGEAGVHRAYTDAPQRVIFLDAPDGHTISILIEDRFPEDAYQAFLDDLALPVIETFVFSEDHR